eukprot:4262642-Pleurochrysis_carterae.AAC.1
MSPELKHGSSEGRRRAAVEEMVRFAGAKGAVGFPLERSDKRRSATAPAACAREILWWRCMRVRLADY